MKAALLIGTAVLAAFGGGVSLVMSLGASFGVACGIVTAWAGFYWVISERS